jgi:septum formation protein
MIPRLILASASPRRHELLGTLGLPFEVIAGHFDEEQVSTTGLTPSDYVLQLAAGKAADVASRTDGDALIIGADTTVVLDGDFLNKPRDADDARRMLRRLSGRTHQVYTGLCVLSVTDGTVSGRLSDHAVTDVTFDDISDETIAHYVATGEPLDKAGAYGIQGKALTFIPGIQGDYFNVVGLPLNLLGKMLCRFGVSLWPV